MKKILITYNKNLLGSSKFEKFNKIANSKYTSTQHFSYFLKYFFLRITYNLYLYLNFLNYGSKIKFSINYFE